jgi:hypothetical protein
MNEKYVYGWYVYRDGSHVAFRYPADGENDLRNGGKKVTVEITFGGDKWQKRRGVVVESNGNYTVIPA